MTGWSWRRSQGCNFTHESQIHISLFMELISDGATTTGQYYWNHEFKLLTLLSVVRNRLNLFFMKMNGLGLELGLSGARPDDVDDVGVASLFRLFLLYLRLTLIYNL